MCLWVFFFIIIFIEIFFLNSLDSDMWWSMADLILGLVFSFGKVEFLGERGGIR